MRVQIPVGIKGSVLRGKGLPIVKYRDTLVNCDKMDEPNEMMFCRDLDFGGPKIPCRSGSPCAK